MTRERYIPRDNQWTAHPEFDAETFTENVYDQVGERFPITVNSRGEIIIETADIPVGVSENEVKQAVRDNHPHR